MEYLLIIDNSLLIFKSLLLIIYSFFVLVRECDWYVQFLEFIEFLLLVSSKLFLMKNFIYILIGPFLIG